MSDLLAVIGEETTDEDLLAEIKRRRPSRVTVLAEERDDRRVASLVDAIQERTGADVVGLAGSRSQLRGWRFDRVVGDRETVAVQLELADPRQAASTRPGLLAKRWSSSPPAG